MFAAFIVNSEFSGSVYVALQQMTTAGALGDWWDETAEAWASSVATSDRRIPLVSSVAREWVGGRGNVGTYTGWVLKRYYQTSSDVYLNHTEVSYFVNGVEALPVTPNDLVGLPLAVRATLQSTPVPASNMVDISSLSTSAELAATLGTIVAETDQIQAEHAAMTSTLATVATDSAAGKAAAQSADGKLLPDTAARLGRLDVDVSSRSSHDAAGVRSELQSNPVDAANMVDISGLGTSAELATLTTHVTTQVSPATTAASAAQSAAETTESRLTATRAGYLDNLAAGAVALESSVGAINNSTRSRFVAPTEVQKPASGAVNVRVWLEIYDGDGALNSADALPAITAANSSGVDRSSGLGTVTQSGVGRYRIDYAVDAAAANEQVIFFATWAENSVATSAVATTQIVTIVSGSGFTTADRTKLESVFDKLPSRSYLTGTDAAAGDISVDTFTGDLTTLHADVSALATSASIAAMQTHGDSTWATASGFATAADARFDNLDATISSRLAAGGVDACATSAELAALQTHGDSTWSTATGFATAADPRFALLDATISSRSTFAAGEEVTLTAGHGLATLAVLENVQAQTALIPAQPAAVGNIPTAGEVAQATNTVLVAEHGNGDWNSDATAANQNMILIGLGAIDGVDSISAAIVSPARTWRLRGCNESALAGNVVELTRNETVTLAMNFRGRLNDQTRLQLVSSVVDSDAEHTYATLQVDQSGGNAHFRVTPTVAGLVRVTVSVTTTDGQQLIGRGDLRVLE